MVPNFSLSLLNYDIFSKFFHRTLRRQFVIKLSLKISHILNTSLRCLVKYERRKQACFVCTEKVLLRCELPCATAFFAPTYYSLLQQMPFSRFFSIVNVNSILSLNKIKITSASNSFEQLYMCRITVCLGQFFSRRLFQHLKPRSP